MNKKARKKNGPAKKTMTTKAYTNSHRKQKNGYEYENKKKTPKQFRSAAKR